MWRKRKASPTYSESADNTRKKRWKGTYVISSSDDENENENEHHRSSLDEDEWYIICILDETKTHYLIDWEGPWSPTWEPRENASKAAIEVWKEKKDAEKKKNKPGWQVVDSSPTRSSLSRLESRLSSSLDPEVEIYETESPHHDSHPDSPLFVPSHQDLESDYPGAKTKLAGLRSQLRRTPLTSPESIRSQSEINQDTNLRVPQLVATPHAPSAVFEYIPRSSIPSQYRLPGETTELYSPKQHDKPPISVVQATQTPSLSLAGIRSREIDEIAETPPRPSTIPESQITFIINNKESGYAVIEDFNQPEI